MFGRFVGHYDFNDIISYLKPDNELVSSIKKYLPDKNIYFFNFCRDALFSALLHRLTLSDKKHIVIPSWGCPIITAVIHKAKFKPLLLDVDPRTLHMNIEEIIYVSNIYDIDSVVLVAENGVPYSKHEISKLKQHGITIISDYALSWQNFNKNHAPVSDYEIFSGGFSKPVSGLGLGVLSTLYEVNDRFTPMRKIEIGKILLLISHLFLQNLFLYKLLSKIIPDDLQKNFGCELAEPSINSMAVILNSLKRIETIKDNWFILQDNIFNILLKFDSKSPSLKYNKFLQTKILIEKSILENWHGKHEIEYHKQYQYDLLEDERTVKIDSDYEGQKLIKKNYFSLSINKSVIDHQQLFIENLQKGVNLSPMLKK